PTPSVSPFVHPVSEPRIREIGDFQRPALVGLQPDGKDKKDKKDKKDTPPPPADDLAAAPPTPTEAPAAFNPNMLGDLGVYSFVNVGIPVTTQIVQIIPGTPGQPGLPGLPNVRPPVPPTPPQIRIINVPTTAFTQVRVPVGARGGIKIAENEGVAPQDRVFVTYNYYNNVHGPAQGSDVPRTLVQTSTVNGTLVTATTTVPGVPPPRFDLH